jgi:FkbM family methyltransferase
MAAWPNLRWSIDRCALCHEFKWSRHKPQYRFTHPAGDRAEAMNDSAILLAQGNLRIKRTRYGLMAYNINDVYLGRSLDVYGEYSLGETDLFAKLIKPGSMVLDIGANIGAHTLFFARAVGPGGGVVAIEPQRAVYQLLCANLALSEINNVRTIQVGAGAAHGRAFLTPVDYAKPGNFGGVAVTEQAGEPTEIITVDSLRLDECHLIKIDVEGHEAAVISGARETIERLRPVLYVENDRRQNSPDLIRQISALGYALHWHCPPLYSPDNFYGHPTNLWPGIVSINMLARPNNAACDIPGLRPVTGPDDWPLAK